MSSPSRFDGRHVLAKNTSLSLGNEIFAGLAKAGGDSILQGRAQSDGMVPTAAEIAGAAGAGITKETIWVDPIQNPRLRGFQFGKWAPETNRFGDHARGKRPHQGIDILAPVGTSVYAVKTGQVTIGQSTGFGAYVMLKFQSSTGETLYAFYAHLSKVTVKNKAIAAAGAEIAKSGATGNADSIPVSEHHLHFGISTLPYPTIGTTNWRDPQLFMKIVVQDKPEPEKQEAHPKTK